jgi:ubiquitin C-terminal hydrolase
VEVLDDDNLWYCIHCDKAVCAQKKVDIWSVPDALIIQLRRFSGSGYRMRKVDTYVDYPDVIDLREFIVGPQKAEPHYYRLYAVSNHMGGMGGGHYTANAIVQSPFEEPDMQPRWYSFNDSYAGVTTGGSWRSAAGYVLCYEKIEGLLAS